LQITVTKMAVEKASISFDFKFYLIQVQNQCGELLYETMSMLKREQVSGHKSRKRPNDHKQSTYARRYYNLNNEIL